MQTLRGYAALPDEAKLPFDAEIRRTRRKRSRQNSTIGRTALDAIKRLAIASMESEVTR